MVKITAEQIKKIATKPNAKIVDDVVKYLNVYADQYGVNTPLRLAHFIAQAAHESANFRTLEEYASGQAYEGRKDLGNTQKGDGKRFKGRGIFQLTGRANYKKIGGILGINLEANPTLAATPEISVRTALEYWKSRNLNASADKDDVREVTKKINGGYNGLEDRKTKLQKAKLVLFDSVQPKSEPIETSKESILETQRLLIKLGYVDVGSIDGKFGTKTSGAIGAFINDWNDTYPQEAIPETTKITKPVIEGLKKAESYGFKRPLAIAREEATVADLRTQSEPIVKHADRAKQGAYGVGVIGGIKVLNDTGVIDQVKQAGEHIAVVNDAIGPLNTFIDLISTYWWLPVGAVIIFLIWQVSKVVKARLEDHRTGNTSVVNLKKVEASI